MAWGLLIYLFIHPHSSFYLIQQELFGALGALKKVSLAFDATGKSKGSAEIVFVRKQDALSAMRKYNGVALDGMYSFFSFYLLSWQILNILVFV